MVFPFDISVSKVKKGREEAVWYWYSYKLETDELSKYVFINKVVAEGCNYLYDAEPKGVSVTEQPYYLDKKNMDSALLI